MPFGAKNQRQLGDRLVHGGVDEHVVAVDGHGEDRDGLVRGKVEGLAGRRSEKAEPCAQHSRVSPSTKPSASEMSPCVQVSPMACTSPAESSTTAIAMPSTSTFLAAALLELARGRRRGCAGHSAAPSDSSASMASASRGADSSGGVTDLLHDLAEEPEHAQAPSLVLGDPARLQVEQVLVVEAARGARVARADGCRRSRSRGSGMLTRRGRPR